MMCTDQRAGAGVQLLHVANFHKLGTMLLRDASLHQQQCLWVIECAQSRLDCLLTVKDVQEGLVKHRKHLHALRVRHSKPSSAEANNEPMDTRKGGKGGTSW